MLSITNDKCISCVILNFCNMVSSVSLKPLPLIQTLICIKARHFHGKNTQY